MLHLSRVLRRRALPFSLTLAFMLLPHAAASAAGTGDDSLGVPNFSPTVPRSPDYRLLVNGRDVPVLRLDGQADFAILSGAGPFTVDVGLFVRRPAKGAVVQPKAAGIQVETSEWRMRFVIPRPLPCAYLEVPGLRPLCLFVHGPESERPDPADPKVRWYRAGGVYEPGEITLGSGETLYIEDGALVRGWVRATDAANVRICGRGVLDGHHPALVEADRYRMLIAFDHCQNVAVEDLTLVRPRFWTIALGASRNAKVRGVRALTELLSTDGVDIVGSSDVAVEGCFLAINDDCVSIKAANFSYVPEDRVGSWRANVERVTIRGCTVLNRGAGAVFEIGHETACDRIGDILYEDCDVIAKKGMGAVFSIHNGDEALIEDITWKRIRVLHHFDKLFDLRIVPTVFSDGAGAGKGRLRRILFEECVVDQNAYNHGYTVSLAGGYRKEAPLDGLVFRDCVLGGKPVTDLDDLELHLRHTVNVRVENSPSRSLPAAAR